MSSHLEFIYSTLIREHQLDSLGHVNNAVYLQIFEEARWELLARQGYGIDVVQSTKKGPVVLELQVKFKQELKAREQVLVRTQMQSYERKIGKLTQKMFNANQELCCESEFTFALFDMQTRKIIEPDAAWKKALGLI